MKIRKRRREISILLIIILLFSSLCFDSSKAKASFACTDFTGNHIAISVTKSVLQEQELCIQELFSERMTNGTFRQESRLGNRVNSKSGSKGRMELSLLESLLGISIFIIEFTAVITNCHTTQSSMAIIDYIHQQDGEKDNI